MRGKSFSGRLSWRIIGIVSVITILAQFAVYYAYKSLQDSPFMHVVMTAIGLASLAAIFFACRAVINYMTRPISRLSNAVLEMAKGNLKAKLPEIKSEDEMQRLHDSFQTMQNSLIDYIKELKTTTAINERIQSDLDLARKIQKGMLLNKFPPFIYAMLNPARMVGGDLYDFTMKGDQVYFAIGDVSGKGVAASLVMAITRVMLRFVVGMGLPLDETLYRLNNSFSESNEMGMFVTLFVARLDLKTGHMDYCNAGHNPILIIPPDGEPFFLRCKANIAIGLIGDFAYEAEQIDLKHGTRLVAYTDGVTEAEKADQSQFGENRLMAWAKELTPLNSELVEGSKDRTVVQDTSDSNTEIAVVESLYDSVKAFTDGNSQNDDITIVSLKL
jgi:sigma-B regulation protein RsbU (phosphoserine phosphatase)